MSDASYRFLPWTRRGMVAQLADAGAPTSLRAKVSVGITVTNAGDSGVDLTLYGPGDVLGIDPRLIVRTEPRPYVSSVEPNYLAAIDFDPPDFPWMFTPAAPDADRLPPWCVLVVLDRDLVGRPSVVAGAPLPTVTVKKEHRAELPDLAESWAWAHVQLATSDDAPPANVADELAGAPDRNVSRIVCPRRLAPGRSYVACVVPAFFSGLQRGLGLVPDADSPAMAPAWAGDPDAPPSDVTLPVTDVTLPVYYHWEFATGPEGDFEALARQLKPFACPATVGHEPMFVGAAGPELPTMSPDDADAYLEMDGALRAPSAASGALDDVPALLRQGLQTAIEAPAHTAGSLPDASDAPAGVVAETLAPPIYGQWHVNRHTLADDAPPWLTQLNRDPRARAAAGVGAEVERANQEEFMHACWLQVGAVMRANELMSQAWLAKDAGRRLHERHLAPLRPDVLLHITAPLHARIRVAPDRTVRRAIAVTSLPDAIADPALRRLMSGQRPAMKALARRMGVTLPASGSVQWKLTAALAAGTDAVDPTTFLADGILSWSGLDELELTAGSQQPVDLTPLGLPTAEPSGDLHSLRASGHQLLAEHASAPARPKLPDKMTSVVVEIARRGPVTAPVSNRVDDPAVVAAFGTAFESWSKAVELDVVDAAPKLVPFELKAVTSTLLERLDPQINVPSRLQAMVTVAGEAFHPSMFGLKVSPTVDRIMVAPDLPVPVYTYLARLFPKRFLPGLDEIPPDSITLLETNPRFVEAFMVGLNQEMNRELLWREFPTDQRGTPFRRFWDWFDDGPDIPPIHSWVEATDLGKRARGGSGGQLVLLVRGQLLRRYPNTIIYAVRPGALLNPDPSEDDVRHPVFGGRFDPDVTFVGFDLADTELQQGEGWLFVLQEQPTEPRFGFDDAPGKDASPTSWSDATWQHMGVATGGHLAIAGNALAGTELGDLTFVTDAAHLAAIAIQKPMRVAIHARHIVLAEG